MALNNDGDETRITTDQVETVLDGDEEEDDEEEERPDDAIDCPFCDQAFARGTCEECGGRRWLSEEEVYSRLGDNLIPCLECGGEGQVDSFGPCSFGCLSCLGTGEMPAANLVNIDLTLFNLSEYPFENIDWSGADFQSLPLRKAFFEQCNFSRANFAGADLTGASFYDCQFHGANPELAASLAGTRLFGTGLSQEQLEACEAMGAIVEDEAPQEASE